MAKLTTEGIVGSVFSNTSRPESIRSIKLVLTTNSHANTVQELMGRLISSVE